MFDRSTKYLSNRKKKSSFSLEVQKKVVFDELHESQKYIREKSKTDQWGTWLAGKTSCVLKSLL